MGTSRCNPARIEEEKAIMEQFEFRRPCRQRVDVRTPNTATVTNGFTNERPCQRKRSGRATADKADARYLACTNHQTSTACSLSLRQSNGC